MEKEHFFLMLDIHTLVWIECPILLKIFTLFRVCKWEVQASCAVSNSVYCLSSFGLCEAVLESLNLQRLPLKLIVFVVFCHSVFVIHWHLLTTLRNVLNHTFGVNFFILHISYCVLQFLKYTLYF